MKYRGRLTSTDWQVTVLSDEMRVARPTAYSNQDLEGEMEDLVGIGRATEKLLEVVTNGIGLIYRPRAIRAEADARAYEVRALGEANLDIERARSAHELTRAIDSKLAVAEAEQLLIERARDRLVQTEAQRQKNVDAIVQLAMESAPDVVSNEPVEPDWTRTLFRLGQDVSDEAMQRLWARVLNGEVSKPGSFSLRSLQVLSTLTKAEVAGFQKLCSLSTGDGRVLVPVQNGMADFIERRPDWFRPWGLAEAQMELLLEAGLIVEGVNIYAGIKMAMKPVSVHDVVSLRLPFPSGVGVFTELNSKIREFNIFCIRLTPVGRELQRLAAVEFDRTYLSQVAATYNLAFRYE